MTCISALQANPALLQFVCDAAPAKQEKFLPGSHIPIRSPEVLENASLDFLVILPWNIATEVQKQNDRMHARGTKFVVAVPNLNVL